MGTQWTLFSQLGHLDFADDLAFLSVKLDQLQEQTDRLDMQLCKSLTWKSPLSFCQISEHLEVHAVYHENKAKTTTVM